MGLECASRRVHKLGCGHLCCWRMDLGSKKMMWQEGSRLGYDRRRRRDHHRMYCHHKDSLFGCRQRRGLPCGCRLHRKRRLEYDLHRPSHCGSTLEFWKNCQGKLVLVEFSKFAVNVERKDILRPPAPAPQAGVRPPPTGRGVRPPNPSPNLPGVAPPILPPYPPRPPSPRPRVPAKRA